MARDRSTQAETARWRANWRALAQTSVWITAALGTFLGTPPTEALFGHQSVAAGLAAFVVAVLAGLAVLGSRLWHTRRYTGRWAAASCAWLLVSVAGVAAYAYGFGHWTADYDNRRVVIGTTLTPVAEAYLKRRPSTTIEDLIWNAGGQTEMVWKRESLQWNALRLLATYVGAVAAAACCVLSLVAAIGSRSETRRN